MDVLTTCNHKIVPYNIVPGVLALAAKKYLFARDSVAFFINVMAIQGVSKLHVRKVRVHRGDINKRERNRRGIQR